MSLDFVKNTTSREEIKSVEVLRRSVKNLIKEEPHRTQPMRTQDMTI